MPSYQEVSGTITGLRKYGGLTPYWGSWITSNPAQETTVSASGTTTSGQTYTGVRACYRFEVTNSLSGWTPDSIVFHAEGKVYANTGTGDHELSATFYDTDPTAGSASGSGGGTLTLGYSQKSYQPVAYETSVSSFTGTKTFYVIIELGNKPYPTLDYIHPTGVTLRLVPPQLSISSVSPSTVTTGGTVTLAFSNRAGRTLSVAFKRGSTTLATASSITDNSYSRTCPLSWFTTAGYSGDTMNVTVVVTPDYGDPVEAYFDLTRPGFAISASSPVTAGSSVSIEIDNRNGNSVAITLSYDNITLATKTVRADSTTIATADSWFSDAGVTGQSYFYVTVSAVDSEGRTASASFRLEAGDSLKPSGGTISFSAVQPSASIESQFSGIYIKGYTKLKVALVCTAQQGASIDRVSFVFGGGASVAMSYNSRSGKWEGTTPNPITSNGTVTVTIIDSRGLSGTETESFSSMTDYHVPSVTITSYHRCNAQQQPDDSGGYCKLIASISISPINDLNSKSAAIASSVYNDSVVLSSYTQSVTWFFAADIEHSYDITVTGTDAITETSVPVSLSTAGVIMDFLAGGRGIGLGKVAETQDMVEVNPTWTLKAGIINLNGTDLGTLLASIQQRLTNGGL